MDFLYLTVLWGAANSAEFHLRQLCKNLRELGTSKQLSCCHRISCVPKPPSCCLRVTASIMWWMFNFLLPELLVLIFSFVLQLDASDSSSSSNLSLAKVRPSSDLNNSTGQSPHHKVQRSISSSQKQRRYSDHGEQFSFSVLQNIMTSSSVWFLNLCPSPEGKED